MHVGVYEARHNGALGEVNHLGVRGMVYLLGDLGDLPVPYQDLPRTGKTFAHPVEDVAAHQYHRLALRQGLSLLHFAGLPYCCLVFLSHSNMG